MAAIYSNGDNRWNILGFNFTKRDALSSLYKISICLKQATFFVNTDVTGKLVCMPTISGGIVSHSARVRKQKTHVLSYMLKITTN
jgi:hypothetical protein